MGFFTMTTIDATGKQVNNTYYFDVQGKMDIGWVKDPLGAMYFFEDAKTSDEGKMCTGWKEIAGVYYYFGIDGKLYVNTTTPDGYVVDATGAWHDPNKAQNQQTTSGVENGTQQMTTDATNVQNINQPVANVNANQVAGFSNSIIYGFTQTLTAIVDFVKSKIIYAK